MEEWKEAIGKAIGSIRADAFENLIYEDLIDISESLKDMGPEYVIQRVYKRIMYDDGWVYAIRKVSAARVWAAWCGNGRKS